MQKITNFTVGADPELFIYDTSKQKIISSDGIIPGEKGDPYRSEDMPEGFGLEVDNILGEFNIPPCTSKEQWLNNINYMKDYIRNFVKKVNPAYDILSVASAYIDEDQLQSDVARLFGCSEDYNVYTERVNEKPNGAFTNLRSTGCHIHFGYSKPTIAASFKMLKYFDMYLGIPSVTLDPDTERRSLYGKAGCFRLCTYGFEYRVLSGRFIATDELISFMWNGVIKAVDAYNNEVPLLPKEQVQDVINNSKVDDAKQLCEKFNLI